MSKHIGIEAILADPTWRHGLEELAERNLARRRAAQRRGELRWKGISSAERSREMKALRAKGGGNPRSTAPRCFCGKYTVHTAESRHFDCCKRAGVYPAASVRP